LSLPERFPGVSLTNNEQMLGRSLALNTRESVSLKAVSWPVLPLHLPILKCCRTWIKFCLRLRIAGGTKTQPLRLG
jgi:hypothetical protein